MIFDFVKIPLSLIFSDDRLNLLTLMAIPQIAIRTTDRPYLVSFEYRTKLIKNPIETAITPINRFFDLI